MGGKQCDGGAAGSGADLSPGHGDRECWRREKLINKISDQQEPSVRSHPPPQSKTGGDVARDAALSQDAQAAILMKLL